MIRASQAGAQAALFAACAALGCARAPVDGPPVVRFGEDVCAFCNMIVNEERFVAGALIEDPNDGPVAVVFDDVSCLFGYEAQGAVPVRGRWIHDAAEGKWIRAETAAYVRSHRIRSPMGGGVLAVAREEAADSLRDRFSGETLTFEAVRAALARGE